MFRLDSMPDDIATKYKLPPELKAFLDDGFLELLSQKDDEKTLCFHIPSKRTEYTRDRIMAYSLVWIRADFNAQLPLLPRAAGRLAELLPGEGIY